MHYVNGSKRKCILARCQEIDPGAASPQRRPDGLRSRSPNLTPRLSSPIRSTRVQYSMVYQMLFRFASPGSIDWQMHLCACMITFYPGSGSGKTPVIPIAATGFGAFS